MSQPIGIFDSGIGGVSVLNTALSLLPQESFVYVADVDNAPYGDRDADFICNRSVVIVDFLVNELNVKAVVVACNTATAYAITTLRAQFSVPIIGVEPAIKPALLMSHSKKIATLATSQTLKGDKYHQLVDSCHKLGEVVAVPCSGLVEIIENKFLNNVNITKYLTKILNPLLGSDIDVVVLGCTHYSLIKKDIEQIFGDKIIVLDANKSVAKRLKSQLIKNNLLSNSKQKITQYYANSDNKILKNLNLTATAHLFNR